MGKLAFRLMHNPHAPDPTAPPSPQTKTGSPNSMDPEGAHPLMQISKFNVEHNIHKKTSALRCVICSRKTSWYCAACTEGPNSIVPVCPCTTRGGGKGGKGCKEHACESAHCSRPGFRLHKRPTKTKRARLDPNEPILEGDSDDDL